MTNSADPDRMASSEANWSASTLLAKAVYIQVQLDKVKAESWLGAYLRSSTRTFVYLKIGYLANVGDFDQTARMHSMSRCSLFVCVWSLLVFARPIGLINDQRMTKPTIRLVPPAKTQISLRIRADWSGSSLIACAFYNIQAIQRGMNEKPCRTGWMYRLIWDSAGHIGLVVGFVVRWLKFNCTVFGQNI